MELNIKYTLDKPKPISDLPLTRVKQKEVTTKPTLTFSQAFAQARKAGKKIFEYNGKQYTTQLKEDIVQLKQKKNLSLQNETGNKSTHVKKEFIPVWEKYSTFFDSPVYKEETSSKKSSNSLEKTPISGIKDFAKLAINGLKRQYALSNAKNDPEAKIQIKEQPIVVGDTTRMSDRRYSLPEIIDLSKFKYGARNRGEYTPIDTEAGIITAFNAFTPVKPGSKGTYIGIDKNGNLKIGDASTFDSNDIGSRIYSNTILKIRKNKNGYETQPAKGNSRLSAPVVDIEASDGSIRPARALNVLMPKDDSSGTTYGDATGGRVIIKVGDELKLVSGSLDTINTVFESMKKRNNTDRGTFYTLDNGTYARAIRTYDSKLTYDDLKDYDLQNTGGGNFLYIKK